MVPPAPPTVTVVGYGSATATPRTLVLVLTVDALEPSASAAFETAAERSATIGSVLDRVGVEAADRSTSALQVAEERSWEDNRQVVLGFRARAATTVRIADPSSVAGLLRSATDLAGASVAGPRWEVGADDPARVEACRRAALDGRARAAAYAEALGLRLGPLLEAV